MRQPKERTIWFRGVGLSMTLILSLLAAPLATDAQQPTKVYRIGWLHSGPRPSEPGPGMAAFRHGLRDLGYVEGQNLVIEYRYAEGRDDRLADLAVDLVRLQVDVIVAGGSLGIRAAQRATRTIPIVMAVTGDAVRQGFVASLSHPGGNITGLSWLGSELAGKRLELLKETVPRSARIAVLANPAGQTYGPGMHNLTVAAQELGLQLHVLELHSADELDPAFAAITREGVDALLVLEEPLLIDHLRGRIADLAATHRLPAMYFWKSSVEAGGLMSYGPSLPDMLRRAATYVDKILKGAKAADLPVEQPTKFEFVINLKVAKALGLTMPPSILFQADEMIQ
jgi:putative tryptophan/tyrosine transport system substrate-binding protein